MFINLFVIVVIFYNTVSMVIAKVVTVTFLFNEFHVSVISLHAAHQATIQGMVSDMYIVYSGRNLC